MAQNYLGLALQGRDRLNPEAMVAYRAAIALDPKDPSPYYNLVIALDERANSAGSEASRVELLAEACWLLTEGLRQAPDEPHLRRELAAIAPELPDSAGCAPGPSPAGQ
jgi:hypothetical protein